MSIVSVLLTLFILGVLAAFHEAGHFFVAKLMGIKVEEFSIFVGPALFSWKKNGVQYHIRCIPFAAYVRYKGMDGETEIDESDPEMFYNHPRWKRLLTSLAGPFMNLILGVIIFMVVFSAFGFTSLRISPPPEGSQIAQVLTEAEEDAGILQAGDRIVAVNGKSVFTVLDINYILSMIPDVDTIELTLRSAMSGEEYAVALTPEISRGYRLGVSFRPATSHENAYKVSFVEPESNGGSPVLQVDDLLFSVNGVSVMDSDFSKKISAFGEDPLAVSILRGDSEMELQMSAMPYDMGNPRGIVLYAGSGFGETIQQSFSYPVSIVRLTVSSLGDVFTGRIAPTDALSGPLGMITIVSDVVDAPSQSTGEKVEQMGILAGFFSVALAFSNLLPIPGLDGNALVLLIVEMIRGKKLSLKTESVINVIGFVCLLALVFFALFSDIFRLVN